MKKFLIFVLVLSCFAFCSCGKQINTSVENVLQQGTMLLTTESISESSENISENHSTESSETISSASAEFIPRTSGETVSSSIYESSESLESETSSVQSAITRVIPTATFIECITVPKTTRVVTATQQETEVSEESLPKITTSASVTESTVTDGGYEMGGGFLE